MIPVLLKSVEGFSAFHHWYFFSAAVIAFPLFPFSLNSFEISKNASFLPEWDYQRCICAAIRARDGGFETRPSHLWEQFYHSEKFKPLFVTFTDPEYSSFHLTPFFFFTLTQFNLTQTAASVHIHTELKAFAHSYFHCTVMNCVKMEPFMAIWIFFHLLTPVASLFSPSHDAWVSFIKLKESL